MSAIPRSQINDRTKSGHSTQMEKNKTSTTLVSATIYHGLLVMLSLKPFRKQHTGLSLLLVRDSGRSID